MPSPIPEAFPEIADFWKVYCSIHAGKGLDVPELIRSWAAAKRKSLAKWSTETTFDELCQHGCSSISLAVALSAIEVSQQAASRWQRTVGPKRRRDQIIRSLTKAATALEEVHEKFIDTTLQDLSASLDPDLRRLLSLDPLLPEGQRLTPEWPEVAPAPHPATIVRALRFYARFFGMVEALSAETQAHSAESLPKYLLSAYVKQATGDFHDREMSALIGSALGTGIYDETAHRMWRSRNYEQLDKTSSSLANLLLGFGVVISSKP